MPYWITIDAIVICDLEHPGRVPMFLKASSIGKGYRWLGHSLKPMEVFSLKERAKIMENLSDPEPEELKF